MLYKKTVNLYVPQLAKGYNKKLKYEFSDYHHNILS